VIKIIKNTKQEIITTGKYKIGDRIRFVDNMYFEDVYEIIRIEKAPIPEDEHRLRYWFVAEGTDWFFTERHNVELVERAIDRQQV
jgi:membrane protease subunit (stomatin/prohibitin family)